MMMRETGMADLHLHTRHSDGAPTVRELLDHVAARTALDVIAITDHDTITGALEAREMACQRHYPFEIIVGEEVTTRQGHLVGLFLSERVAPGLSARETVAAIHAQGGLAFAPHPFLRCHQDEGRAITMVGLGEVVRELDLDAIETINGAPFLGHANRQAAAYNAGITRLPTVGGSDGHIAAAAGKGYTRFPGKTAHDLRAAIEAGQTEARAQRYTPRELLAYLRFWVGQQRHPSAMLEGFLATREKRAARVAS